MAVIDAKERERERERVRGARRMDGMDESHSKRREGERAHTAIYR